MEEDGSLAEIGPRFVLNPIKVHLYKSMPVFDKGFIFFLFDQVFESSFSGQTLWENGDYVTPTAHRLAISRYL